MGFAGLGQAATLLHSVLHLTACLYSPAKLSNVVAGLKWSTAGIRPPSGKQVWLVRIFNGSTAPAMFRTTEYRVILNVPQLEPEGAVERSDWLPRSDAMRILSTAGLHPKSDYELRPIGPAFPLSASSPDIAWIAWFGIKAMKAIDDILVRVEATDQAGDTHQRIVHCMRGAERNIAGPRRRGWHVVGRPWWPVSGPGHPSDRRQPKAGEDRPQGWQ